MKAFAKTDIGKARDMNQDSFFMQREDGEFNLYILADGMGGYKGGEIASSLAVSASKNYILNNFKEIEKTKENIFKLINDSIEYANMIVFEKSKEDKELNEMGTTIDVCLIYNNKMYIGHVGDSRVYRLRKGIIRKITTDHSYVEKLVRDGTITREEAFNHPKKNMLIKALGCNSFVEPDVIYKVFQKGDTLLMCSDGLTNMVKEEEINQIILSDVEHANNNLVQRANECGGYDNITVIVVENN